MDNPWQTVTPIERQAAAAELWMELTGRTKEAQAKIFEDGVEALEKVACRQAPLTEKTAVLPPRRSPLVTRGERRKAWHPQDQSDETLHALNTRMERARSAPAIRRWAPSSAESALLVPTGAIAGAGVGLAATKSLAGGLAGGLAGAVGLPFAAPAGRNIGQALSHRRVKKEIARRAKVAALEKVPSTGPNHPPHPGHVPGDEPPKLRNYVGAGAAAGGTAGAGVAYRGAKGLSVFKGKAIPASRQIAQKGFTQAASKGQLLRRAAVGGGVAGAGLGATAGLGIGIHKLVKHIRKGGAPQEKKADKKKEIPTKKQDAAANFDYLLDSPKTTEELAEVGDLSKAEMAAWGRIKRLRSAHPSPTPEDVRAAGRHHERLGRKLRNVGYGGGALMLGGSFLPGVRGRNWARRGLRAGAMAGAATGYFGEHGIRVGRGYLHAADVHGGKARLKDKAMGLEICPSAYNLAHSALQKKADAKTRAIGAGAGALTLGTGGALKSYLDHKPGKDGKSKAMLREEAELERMKALFKNQGKDVKNLPGMDKMKKRYAELRHEHVQHAKESPVRAAAKQAAPWALMGAGVGMHLAPKASKVLARLK